MAAGTKIATCCYCGARAALVLTGTVRHELACASCGAPLHDLKGLPIAAPSAPIRARPTRPTSLRPKKQAKTKKAKRPKAYRKARGLFSDAFDLLEDLFD
ncbi:hypothetical protein [Pseudoruegeria sp. SK021]|uniref:hypothetical protein n=1 Tax=Pseudoruegeria sp. SK021 TaxID=1933035 RepID=UPI000A22536D|nr:hypothetical protein [Pseudoruegeria sp. SK021]OSP56444.1 hypothetical protein BV911_00300 [Pseudoruegeria sp. SK021]